MLKFIQKSLVICSASLGISGLACANDGWEYDSNGRYDMFSSKNHARADMLERKEAQASKAKTAQYEPYRHPLNGNPYGPPVYIPAASYHGTPSSSDTSRSIAPSKRPNTDRSATGGLPDMRPESETPYQKMQRDAMNEIYGKPYGGL
jgi:hypothetical protein